MGVAYVGIHILEHLKEELAWAIDKWLWFISNMKAVIPLNKKLKNKALLNLQQYCMHCHVALSSIF